MSSGGRSVFVGNIPYGLTEEQITDIFSQVGRVKKFRLLYDKDTGRPKGFGFIEFEDADMAASAVRNLNDYEIMNRKLRVDYSHDGEQDQDQPDDRGTTMYDRPQPPQSTLPPLPIGTDLPPNLSAPDAISRTLYTLPPPQLLDALSQMKSLVLADPIQASTLLRQAPQLSYAIFQALLLMNLVDTTVLAQVVETATAPPPAPPPVQAPYQPPPQQYQPPYQPPPQVQAQPLPADPTQAALIQQVLMMTEDVVRGLPPDQQAQIRMLKQTYGGAY